ncbi:MAG: helix-turn-helix domain-containing protein [Nanoarchaeota archaeon]
MTNTDYSVQRRIEIVKAMEKIVLKSPSDLIDFVCELMNVPKDQVLAEKGPKRNPELLSTRHVIQYLLEGKFHLGKSEIGRLTNRDHGSVINAIKGIEGMLQTYGKQVNPIHIPESLLRKYSEQERDLSYIVQTPLEILAPVRKSHVYYIVLNQPTLRHKKLSKTLSLG